MDIFEEPKSDVEEFVAQVRCVLEKMENRCMQAELRSIRLQSERDMYKEMYEKVLSSK